MVVIVISFSLLEQENQRLAFFHTIDIVTSGFVMLAEEVIGLDNRLPLILSLRLLCQLLLVPPAL